MWKNWPQQFIYILIENSTSKPWWRIIIIFTSYPHVKKLNVPSLMKTFNTDFQNLMMNLTCSITAMSKKSYTNKDPAKSFITKISWQPQHSTSPPPETMSKKSYTNKNQMKKSITKVPWQPTRSCQKNHTPTKIWYEISSPKFHAATHFNVKKIIHIRWRISWQNLQKTSSFLHQKIRKKWIKNTLMKTSKKSIVKQIYNIKNQKLNIK